MKLFVVVVALLSERFFVHAASGKRFYWFSNYCHTLISKLQKIPFLSSSWAKLVAVVTPLLTAASVILYISGSIFYGFAELVFNIIIFYYCLGPENPFYFKGSESSDSRTANYLIEANSKLFAVIFWYMALGPLATLLYRMISLCQNEDQVDGNARLLTGIFEWLPAKMTALLYLLAGNFQAGFHHFAKLFFTLPSNNQNILRLCGLGASGIGEEQSLNIPQAETLVEHALLILLVLLSFLTLASWV